MPRTVRNSKVDTPSARARLPRRRSIYWSSITPGFEMGYRQSTKSGKAGAWVAKLIYDDEGGKVRKERTLGAADDALDADGKRVLSYAQAQEKARTWRDETLAKATVGEPEPYAVKDAIRDYLAWFERHRKGLYQVRSRANADILPELGNILVDDLDAKTIRAWHERQSTRPPRRRGPKYGKPHERPIPTDPDGIRKRKATANKGLTILKAALNHAFAAGHARSDDAWRRVKPFKNVDAARVRYLSIVEAQRLINASPDDLRRLVRAALYTGGRYGELTTCEVMDFNPDSGTLHFRFTKADRPRYVHLTDEGQTFFRDVVRGRPGGERMFLREDGKPWGKSHQIRRLADACAAAQIEPAIGFHILRHSYGSWLAMRGVPLQVIANTLGHADTRITERHYAALSPSYVADTVRANLPALEEQRGNVVDLPPMREQQGLGGG